VLHLDAQRLAVTVFAGDANAPPRRRIGLGLRSLGIPPERIFFLPKEDNWWGPAGASGPCGPDSEMFYDTQRADHPGCRPGCACGKWLEIWNNVFMEYEKTMDGRFVRPSSSATSTPAWASTHPGGFTGVNDIFLIETLYPLVQQVERLSGRSYTDNPLPFRVIVDHLRAATLRHCRRAMPSNVEAGYVVRRLIRRRCASAATWASTTNFCAAFSTSVVDLFQAGLSTARA